MIVEQLVEWRWAGETEVLGENLPQRHFVHHKIPHDQTQSRTSDRRSGKPATNRLSYGAAFVSNNVQQDKCDKTVMAPHNVKLLVKSRSVFKHHDMKIQECVEVQLHVFSTTVSDGGEWSCWYWLSHASYHCSIT
jgi:hypothetical protein